MIYLYADQLLSIYRGKKGFCFFVVTTMYLISEVLTNLNSELQFVLSVLQEKKIPEIRVV